MSGSHTVAGSAKGYVCGLHVQVQPVPTAPLACSFGALMKFPVEDVVCDGDVLKSSRSRSFHFLVTRDGYIMLGETH